MVHVNRLDNCKGCERELASALKKKKVPLIVVKDRAQARYEITGVVTVLKTYTTFTAAGLGTSVESEKISIQIVDREKSSVVYTDTVSDKVGKVMKECAEHIMNDALAP